MNGQEIQFDMLFFKVNQGLFVQPLGLFMCYLFMCNVIYTIKL
jgi:hypothetical protein